jgi:hypothetical protein
MIYLVATFLNIRITSIIQSSRIHIPNSDGGGLARSGVDRVILGRDTERASPINFQPQTYTKSLNVSHSFQHGL